MDAVGRDALARELRFRQERSVELPRKTSIICDRSAGGIRSITLVGQD